MTAVTMIDLSFLTEEEQETILTVLKRDAELKKAEEQRVQNLQKTVSDKGQLKYLTGEWFYETKQLRHQDRVHGSDIIRASMRHSHKPLTILEFSRILPEKSSFVISENKEVFVPPVLCGLLQEPHLQLCNERYQNKNLYETPQETPKSVLQSPTKRKNPFNRELNASHTFKEMNSQLLDGAVDQSQKLNEDVSEKCNSELLSPAVSSLLSSEQKSDPLYLETETKEDHHSQAGATDGLTRHNICQQKLPEQSSGISVEVTRPLTSGSSKCSFQAVSPQPRQRLLGIFTREEERSAELHSLQEKEVKIQQEEPGKSQNLGTVDMTVGKHASVKNETKCSEMREFRTLTALEKTTFKETVTTMDADCQQDATEGRAVEFPERLSNLKAFWEKKKTGPKIDFIREEARQEDIPKTGVEVSHGPQTYMERMNNLSFRREMTFEDTTGRSQAEISSPQTEFSLFVDLSKGDGTYRANPVLIYEETDDSLTGSLTESQISKSQKNNVTPVPSSVTFNAQESFLRHTISGPQEDKPTRITDHFLEIEHTGPKIIPARVKEAPRSSLLINKVVSPQSYLRTSLDKREKSKGEAQTSPYKTKPNVVFKSLKVTDKCFVSQSPDGSQLRSSSGTGDAQSTCQQYQVKERPFSPSKSQRQRSKDQDEEVRRSPSKTCHPRVLPKESFSPKRSRLEGSLLKTFPIDIKPETKEVEEQQGQPTPVARQRKSPSHAAKQTALADSKPSTDITSCLLHLQLEEREAYFGHLNTQPNNSRSTSPQSIKASEKKLGTFKCLGRSFISQDCQHYLGPQEKAYFPPFHHEKCVAEENDVIYGPSAFRNFVGDQSDSPTESNHPRICSWIVEKKDGNSSQDTTTRAWFLSWASSGSYDESSSPIMSALKQLPSRSMSSSKSLENFTSQTREERTKTNPREQINLSVDDVSSLPTSASTLSNSKQIKSSVSVPVLQQDETDSDSTFKTYLGWRRNTGSSTSNISLSSGMVSTSSVSGSISSNNTIDFGDIEVQGSIQFAVNYIQKLGEFHIFVVHCRELAMARTKKNRSDPYVKCYLLPDKTKLGKRKTTVKKKTLNPTYNEILRFKVIMEVLKTQNLNISVWHNESFGQNSFLGEVELDLSEWDFSNTQINEYALKARVSAHTSVLSPSHLMDSRGQMRVALRFLPQTSHGKRATRMETGEVQIWVKDCKNLPSVREVIIDPFVKSMVLPDTSRKSRQKTRVVKRTANPMFNHTMVYDGFRKEDLREACVEITVWDHDRLKSLYIGGLRLGLGTGKSYGVEVDWMDSTRDETNLWQRMLQSDHEWVEDVLPLRMFVMAKNMSK